jgi:phage shock protein PspC (stress-responsive transcriptional regulator)
MSGTQGPDGEVWGTPEQPSNQGHPPSGAQRTVPPTGGGDPGDPGGPAGWGPPPEQGSPQRHTGDEFFARIREFGASRPPEGRWVAGVASGLSRRLDIDQTLIRGTFVALSVVGGLGVALYGICWMLLPQQQDGRIHLQEAFRGHFSYGFFGAVLLSLALLGGGGGSWFGPGGFWGFPGTLILAGLIVAGLWWMSKKLPQPDQPSAVPGGPSPATSGPAGPGNGLPHWTTPEGSRQLADHAARWGRETGDAMSAWAKDFSQRTRTAHEEAAWQRHEAQRLARARTAPSRRVRQLTLGLALIVVSGVLAAEAFGDVPGWAGLTALGAAITVIAGGVIANGLLGRRSPGLAGLGILLTLILSAGAAAQHAGVQTSGHLAVVGASSWNPQTREAAGSQYNLGVGEADLDLTSAGALRGATPTNPLEVEANLGVGHLVLTVPAWLTVEVDARLGAGEVVQPDGTRYEVKGDSSNRDRTLTYGSGRPAVKVVVQQGVGQMEIQRQAQNRPIGTDDTKGSN